MQSNPRRERSALELQALERTNPRLYQSLIQARQRNERLDQLERQATRELADSERAKEENEESRGMFDVEFEEADYAREGLQSLPPAQ